MFVLLGGHIFVQIGPDGSFLDFFTQSAQPPDIVQRIKGYFKTAQKVMQQ